MIYKAKYDKSVLLIPISIPFLMTIATTLINNYSFKHFAVMLSVGCLLSFIYIYTILSVKYILTDSELVICILGIKRKVKYRDIYKVQICRGPWKIESPSLQQLHLYGKEKKLATISVNELQQFKGILLNKCEK